MMDTSHCNIYGFLGLVFILSSVCMIFLKSPRLLQRFEKTLDEKQKHAYKNVVQERQRIYFMGFLFAFIFALLYTYIGPKEGLFYGSITIFLLVHYLFYILHPKSRFIVEILDKLEQRKAWIELYRHMSFAYHFAFVLSFVGVGLLLKISC